MPANSEVADWINKAEEDYNAALALMRQRARPLPNLVCFHAQQCAEKYLKATLIFHRRSFPKTHDLIVLYELCQPDVPGLDTILEALSVLSPYGVDARYPGTASTTEEAKEATETMKVVRKFLRKHLGEE